MFLDQRRDLEEKGSFWAILFFCLYIDVGDYAGECWWLTVLWYGGGWCFGDMGKVCFIWIFNRDLLRVYRVLVVG